MGSLAQAKTLGGVGSILTLLGIIPYAGTALVVVGWILVLIGIKYVSEAVQDRSIYNNAIIAAILAIVGAGVGAVVLGVNVFRFIGSGGSFSSLNSTSFSHPTPAFVGLITGVIAGLVVLWILAII